MAPKRHQLKISRISVVGTTGSGKTTVAHQLSQILGLPHIELDALYWDNNWTGVTDKVFKERISQALRGEAWVMDGNYSRVQPLIWKQADTVVYLDYSFWRVFIQLIIRTLQRSIMHTELWSGNREELSRSLFSRDSIVLWMLKTYHSRRKQYPELFRQPDYSHLEIVHLKNPRMTRAWLSSLETVQFNGFHPITGN
jgi:adenylate kinase family enzyme